MTPRQSELKSLINGKIILKNRTIRKLLYAMAMLPENILGELDTSAKLVNVLMIKTDLAIPYTSVFFQLDCG
ncbi:hypothetical protein GCM10007028_26980 [Algibacter mikhailovii]|uniref:Uncharacterized protein n=1 Tax=Algibacter mikhailovii TaxID=425498 RepID=A0A918R605_9FLAO|nr:hypothetical protein GCM10007028_26980 [Algibacter mikhailovii]